MRINLILLFALSCSAAPVAAQTVYLPTLKQKQEVTDREKAMRDAAILNKMNAINDVGTNGYDIVVFDSRLRGIRGTPFLVPTWSQGDVVVGASKTTKQAVLKFDVYNQQVRVWRPTQNDSIIIAPEDVYSFTLRPTGAQGKPVERHFERLPATLISESPIAYAENLSTGNELRLLRFYKKTILKGHADIAYGGAPVDSFQDATQYFLRWSDGTYATIKPNRSSVLAAVALRYAAVAGTEMQNKAKVRSDAELGELVARLNSTIANSSHK